MGNREGVIFELEYREERGVENDSVSVCGKQVNVDVYY